MALTSIKEVFEKMPQVFNPTAAAGLDLVYQFDISGDQGGKWNVIIKDGACLINEGVYDNPTVTLIIADVDWLAICNGTLNGMTAFMTGKLKATGNIMAAQRIQALFPL